MGITKASDHLREEPPPRPSSPEVDPPRADRWFASPACSQWLSQQEPMPTPRSSMDPARRQLMPLPCCSSSMAEVLRWGEDSFTLARPTRATVPPGMAVLPTARRPDTSAPTSWSSTAASLTARGTTGPAGQLVGGAATMGEATGGSTVFGTEARTRSPTNNDSHL